MNQFSIGIGNKRGVSVSLSRRCAMYVQCCAVMCSAVQEGMDRAITQYFRQIAVISDKRSGHSPRLRLDRLTSPVRLICKRKESSCLACVRVANGHVVCPSVIRTELMVRRSCSPNATTSNRESDVRPPPAAVRGFCDGESVT